MMGRIGKNRLLAVAALAALTVGTSARAGLIPVQVSVTPDSGKFRWTYAVVVTTDVKVNAGDSFTIYDFGGFQAGSVVAPAGWSASSLLTGPIRPGTSPDDDSSIPNLTFTFTGNASIQGSAGLGNFWAMSDSNLHATSDFTSTSHRQVDGRLETNITTTDVPVTPSPVVAGAPEPASLALLGVGLPVVGLVNWLRRRK